MGGVVQVSDVYIQARQPTTPLTPDSMGCVAVNPTDRLVATRAALEGCPGMALYLEGQAEVEDIRITGVRWTTATGSPEPGIAAVLAAYAAADVSVERADIDGETCASLVAQSGAHLAIADLTTRPLLEDLPCITHDLAAVSGATMRVDRAVLTREGASPLLATGPMSELDANDVTILDAARSSTFPHPRALSAEAGAVITGARIELHRSRGLGVFAGNGGRLTLEDLLGRDGELTDAGPISGGVLASMDGEVEISRGRIVDFPQLGVVAVSRGRVSLHEVEITGATALDCDPAGDAPCIPGGIGLAAYRQGVVEATRFALHGHGLVAAQVREGGGMTLEHGVISDTPIGVNVDDSMVLRALATGVRFVAVGTRMDSTELPIPDLSVSPIGL
jgi:hypothetical protein